MVFFFPVFLTCSREGYRIGHMGANANIADMTVTMAALSDTLQTLGVPLHGALDLLFLATFKDLSSGSRN